MFSLSVLDRKCPIWVNLVQKVKIVSLSWNLEASLTRIYKMMPFTFSGVRREIPFLGKFGPKNQIASLRWNLIPGLIRIRRVQRWCSFFLFLIPFWPIKSELSVQLEISYILIASTKILEREGSISLSRFYRKLHDN